MIFYVSPYPVSSRTLIHISEHPKVKLFITHGGYNSFQEAIYASTPMIVIPLFGDQKRNARLVQKHEIGLRLDKSKVNEKNLYAAIQTVLETRKYASNIAALNAIVTKKPFTPEETLLKWTDFLVQIKSVPNLTPATVEMSFIRYHNLDVFAFLALILLAIFWLLQGIVACCFPTKRFEPEKPQHEKRE